MARFICAIALLVAVTRPAMAGAQIRAARDRIAADELITAALRDSSAHARLSRLVDGFGHRLSGSESLERAID